MGLERSRSDGGVTPEGFLFSLLGLKPKQRLIAGIICVAGGALLTFLLWGKGVIWGLTLLAVAVGVPLSISGLLGMKEEARRREYLASLRERQGEILRGLVDAKLQGKNVVAWLSEQGVRDVENRTKFIDAMNRRLKAVKPAGDPGAQDPSRAAEA